MELLPPNRRIEIMDERRILRVYPSLENPKLAHDATIVSQLKTILRGPNGLILVRGDNDEAVTFVANALGHSSRAVSRQRHTEGLDRHLPDWFVPVPGIIYLDNLLGAPLDREFENAWPSICERKSSFVLVNGLGASVQRLNEHVRLAQQSLVVVADAIRPPALQAIRDVPSGGHLITVFQERDRIRLEIQVAA